ncbi:MAG: porin family protein [Oceanicaulis sp.]
MRIILAALACACVPLTAAQGQVSQNVYGEVGYTRVSFDDVGYNTAGGRLGLNINDLFGVEGEAFFGVGEETTTVMGVDVDSSLNYTAGLYGTVRTGLGDATEIIGRLGYATAEVEASVMGAGVSGSDDAIAGGVGVRHYIGGGAFGVRGDITYADYDGGESTSYAITLVRRF